MSTNHQSNYNAYNTHSTSKSNFNDTGSISKIHSSTDAGINGTVEDDFDTETITIVKAGGPLGLSIVGGTDHTSHPFGLDEPGIFISKVRFNYIQHAYISTSCECIDLYFV